METNALYQNLVAATKAAVSSTEKASNCWVKAGLAAAEAYPSAEALQAIKVQFCADAIVPAMKAEHRDALLADIPRKGTEEYNAAAAKWDALKATRKAATATRDTYFANVVKYASRVWNPEPEKAEGEDGDAPKASESDKARKIVADLITRLQTKEGLDFDVTESVKVLQAALTAMQPKK